MRKREYLGQLELMVLFAVMRPAGDAYGVLISREIAEKSGREVALGSVYAALMPLVTALLGVVAGIGLLGTLAAAISFGTASPTLATMMGLGVGIDYALFLITRHRQLLIDGEDPDTAIRHTMARSGHSLVIAGSTVIIAMLGLYASGIAFIGKLGLAASLTVAVAMLAGVTLVVVFVELEAELLTPTPEFSAVEGVASTCDEGVYAAEAVVAFEPADDEPEAANEADCRDEGRRT